MGASMKRRRVILYNPSSVFYTMPLSLVNKLSWKWKCVALKQPRISKLTKNIAEQLTLD